MRETQQVTFSKVCWFVHEQNGFRRSDDDDDDDDDDEIAFFTVRWKTRKLV